MTKDQERELCTYSCMMYALWAGKELCGSTEQASRIQNGFFNVAKKIWPDDMLKAFTGEHGMRRK